MRTQFFAAAAGLFALSATAAFALPVGTAQQIHLKSAGVITPIAHDDDDHINRRRRHHSGIRLQLGDNDDRRSYRYRHRDDDDDDDEYRQYRGWHRYSHRPRGWEDRNCVSVGPLWFCP